MNMATDEFKINLNLHHPSCDPETITETLALKPWFAKKNGKQHGFANSGAGLLTRNLQRL
jgi:hypothetical protein